jgi:hypothetical protein
LTPSWCGRNTAAAKRNRRIKVEERYGQLSRRVTRRSWQRLADRGLCCCRCGGSEGVWAPKVFCRACRLESEIGGGGAE